MNHASTARNRVRIISGQWRRRLITFPDAEGLRPTPDAVREKLFNWLGQELHGLDCLDLFAGSGALGFEAASRGARRVVMVEKNRVVLNALQLSAAALAANNVVVLQGDGVKFLSEYRGCFDVVFLDPPYAAGLQVQVLAALPPHLNSGASVYVEHDGDLATPAGWKVWRQGRSGKAHFCLLKQAQEQDGHV
ncbi:lactate dehydrogenase [Sulfuriferula plumbiphila]|uniref:Lactate dehydrogenase n=1 Tax=Sulfuriferula plumbiphila TaxID=171865 RepID=A0A512L6Y3_9PROT|nr:16S rRNA (guanine(966)-N(2))-methyltransferase RsmD [Sulfuriferula plumbiphila]BBP02883.1 lactate dehydrogenase [Sulfuriferula plumbiphila]GEP30250.1 lactate dehydrogenase [Sulfuriferula plumbiphila]